MTIGQKQDKKNVRLQKQVGEKPVVEDNIPPLIKPSDNPVDTLEEQIKYFTDKKGAEKDLTREPGDDGRDINDTEPFEVQLKRQLNMPTSQRRAILKANKPK